jgi:hypothetical protein
MSRLKYTRRRVNIIKITSAAQYLTRSRSLVPEPFSYFYKLDIFKPPALIQVDDMARIFYVCRATAIKNMREIQKEYNRPALNFVTVKDVCKYYKIDKECIHKYFFHEEAINFFERTNRLKSK